VKESGYAGEPIELIAEPGETTETMSSVLQAQLKRIGMNVRLAIMDVSTYNARQRKGEFAFRFRGGDFYPDPWSTYGRDLRCGDLKRRIANNAGYCDPQVESLLDRAETEMDPDKRKMFFKQIMTKVAEDVPEIFIGFVPRFFTVREHVNGFTTDDNGAFRWWGGGLNAAWLDKGRER
jgi:peptide/nickel transport system substrate-binding protein